MQNFFLSTRLNSHLVVGFHPGSTCRGWGPCCASWLWGGEAWKCYGKSKHFIFKLSIATKWAARSASRWAFCFASILQEASEASKQFTFFYTSPQVFQLKHFKLINQLFQNEPELKQSQSSWTERTVLREGGLRPSSCPPVKHLQTAKFPKPGDQFSSQSLGCLHICHHLWVFLPNRKTKIPELNQVAICRFPLRKTKTIIYTSSFNPLLSGCSCPSLERCRERWPRRNVLNFAASGHSVRY